MARPAKGSVDIEFVKRGTCDGAAAAALVVVMVVVAAALALLAAVVSGVHVRARFWHGARHTTTTTGLTC